MRKKIAEALRNRYSNLGLTEKAFDGVAGMLEKTVTEESQIQSAIESEEVSALLKSIQGETDALRTARTQAQRELEDYKKSHPETKKPEEGSGGEDGNAEMLRQLKSIQDRLDERDRREKSAQTLAEVDRLLKEKGATNDFIRRMTSSTKSRKAFRKSSPQPPCRKVQSPTASTSPGACPPTTSRVPTGRAAASSAPQQGASCTPPVRRIQSTTARASAGTAGPFVARNA